MGLVRGGHHSCRRDRREREVTRRSYRGRREGCDGGGTGWRRDRLREGQRENDVT